MRDGHSAVGTIRRFDASAFPSRIAAEVLDPPPEVAGRLPADLESSPADRAILMGWWAARTALSRAGPSLDRSACGMVYTAGGYGSDHDANLAGLNESLEGRGDFDAEAFVEARAAALGPGDLGRHVPGAAGPRLGAVLGVGGPHLTLDSACASGAEAVATAGRWIRAGRARRVLAVAADSHVSPFGISGFCLLGALSQRNDEPERASRPFDVGRDGFVLGEGAGALVLEHPDDARGRDAEILGELRGWGSACDAHRITDPHPDARGAFLALDRALGSADLAPDRIGYVNAHGTSTPANDRTESLALHRVFSGSPPPTSSTKSMIGHLVTAAGAVEAIVTLLALRDQVLPPTINVDRLDPECPLDVVPHRARPAAFEHALSSSFGFGGSCTCLLLSRGSTA